MRFETSRLLALLLPRGLATLVLPSCMLALAACSTRSEPPVVQRLPQAQPTPRAEPGQVPPEISGIAEREIIRRQERMRQADEAALRAARRQADGDLEGATQEYRRAIDTLPDS